MKWILDEERECITCNAEPILEGSFYNNDCRKALKIAVKAPEMLDMLIDIRDALENGYTPHVYKIDELIKKTTES